MTAIHPRDVLGIPRLLLVDIRPTAERHGGVGFIPASVSVPWQPEAERWAAAVRAVAGERTPVLVCLSGTRARNGCAALPCFEGGFEGGFEDACSQLEGGMCSHLEGGVLAWGAEGLPLCGRDLPRTRDEPPLSLQEVPRHLAACFVGELAEASLDRPDLDPLALLERCFRRAGTSPTAPTLEGLLHVLDHAALASFELGTPLARVATNIDHMLGRLPLPQWSRVA
jgi:rhodanese-related sulfurtransferase